MEAIDLRENETKEIKSFIEEASKIPAVECIFLLENYSYLERKEIIHVISIYNEGLEYNELLTGKKEERFNESVDEIYKLKSIIKEYNERNKKTSLEFMADDYRDYFISMMNYRQWQSERALANGEIVFDRFGIKTKNQEFARIYFDEGKDNKLILK